MSWMQSNKRRYARHRCAVEPRIGTRLPPGKWASCALIGALLGVLQGSALAASSASGAWTLLHAGDFDWRERSDRLRVATDLKRRVMTLSARVPEQSPEELARVANREARLKDGQAQARSRLFLSAEYQLRELRKTLGQIQAALLCVEQSERMESEMACWSNAAVALLKEDQMRLALDTLRKNRRIPRKRNTPIIDRDPDLWYAHFGRGILTSVIGPYLNDLGRAEQPTRSANGERALLEFHSEPTQEGESES